MNFFKKLFSSGSKSAESGEKTKNATPLNGVFTQDYFDGRYTEEDVYKNPAMLDGCLKMVESYFIDNKIVRKIADPVNHPVNLDQTIDDGFGFVLYCKAVGLGDSEAALFLAYAFSEYLVKTFGFKLYKDKTPEYPLRGMTLKYDRNGVVLSLYPFEYATKALNYEARFEDLLNKLEANIQRMPEKEDMLNQFLDPEA